jgi:hypothetical protein
VFFDSLIGLGLVIVINGVCSRLGYCEILLKSLLVLAVLLLAYLLGGVAPTSAPAPTLDVAVVRGTDGGVYWNSYNSVPSWGSWQSLSGATSSPPGICEEAGGIVYVVVRGTDNGIYLKAWSTGSGWSASWAFPPGGGATINTPACAYLSGLVIVVRGMNNELYWTWSNGMTWSGWADLSGASASAPVLVSTPSLGRLDLFVQGTDNGIYHKAYKSGAWSNSWDSPGGATPSRPAAALYFYHDPSSSDYDVLELVVRGTDNGVYYNFLQISPLDTGLWTSWHSLGGATLSAPTFAFFDNGCTSASPTKCSSIDALAVRGTDNALYYNALDEGWDSWDSPGGSIASSPASAYIPGTPWNFLFLVEGYPSNHLYSNTVSGNTWGGYVSLSGATPSDPALVAVV